MADSERCPFIKYLLEKETKKQLSVTVPNFSDLNLLCLHVLAKVEVNLERYISKIKGVIGVHPYHIHISTFL